MMNRTKKQLRALAVIAIVSLIVTIVTIVLLGKTFQYWNIAASMHSIEEQTQYTGWDDEKTSAFESLLYERNELARNDSYMNWLLQCSRSNNGVIVRDFAVILTFLFFGISIWSIYKCISTAYKVVTNTKKQIRQRDPYREKQLRTNRRV